MHATNPHQSPENHDSIPLQTRFDWFCGVVSQIANTRSTTEKTHQFAGYLQSLCDNDTALELAVQYIGEGAFSTVSSRRAAIGHRTIAQCAAEFCEIDYERVFRPSRTATGSSSETIEKLMANVDIARSKRHPAALTLSEVSAIFENLAALRTRAEKEHGLTAAWRQMTPSEIKYFLRILGGGSLRIGFESRSILSAIALAFARDPEAVRYTHMLTGSLGRTVLMARHDTLEDARFRLFQPFAFMLAAPAETRSTEDYTCYIAEEKFDGMRCQLHLDGPRVQLFSRDLNDITASFPDISAPFADKNLSPTVLDGEICAFWDNTIQPFQQLQKRMGVKKPGQKLLQACPVTFIAYDLVYTQNAPLFDSPLSRRRVMLEEICARAGIRLVEQFPILDEQDLERLFHQAIAHGNEGLILKDTGSRYEYGQRRKSWMKVKKPGGSLDTVILYATAGSGKRGGTYSDFTLGVRTGAENPFGQEFVPIGKAYGGYTDVELKRLNEALKPLVRERFGPTLALEPKLVVEIEFDEIQVNTRTKAGYTLRFPRFKAIRWDKGPLDTDTLTEVERLYNEKQSRKRLPQHENPSFR